MVAGPLRRVLAAIEGGAGSLADIERATGLDRDVVEASVDHLIRIGRLETRPLALGCDAAGCSECAVRPPSAGPECAVPGRGAGLTVLTVRRDPTP